MGGGDFASPRGVVFTAALALNEPAFHDFAIMRNVSFERARQPD